MCILRFIYFGYTTSVQFQISTNKERHSRLGEDNLDDTLEYDFAGECLKVKKIEDVNAKKSGLLNDQNVGQETEAEKNSDSMELIVSDPLTPITKTQACVLYCGSPNPCTSYLKDENSANIKECITDLEREKY